ncbi:hypothetical protein P5F80_10710 [Shouchella clausii]|uniref:hypothetical protein n=1 Tax=Shouchella clausii TaxID=79880 RepID=UPI001C217943|nr:hypothetical protein [Shouchella clausii]MBU8597259.1 hypothetical protein [Shouchella clausii]MED4159622.1 hypothetical protein [Shouchella clausii]MED4176996.1 hypothetical protein [Shouchella clausii]
MERDIDQERVVLREVEVTENAKKEGLASVFHQIKARRVDVQVEYLCEDGTFIDDESYAITGENYDLLMAAYPQYSPDKPANDFYYRDVWYIVDLIRANEQRESS